jgi:hypothetical protein
VLQIGGTAGHQDVCLSAEPLRRGLATAHVTKISAPGNLGYPELPFQCSDSYGVGER